MIMPYNYIKLFRFTFIRLIVASSALKKVDGDVTAP